MSSDKILVTAATGNIGAPLIKALQKKDIDFTAATRNAQKAKKQLGEGVTTVHFDYEDSSSFDEALDGHNLLFLCGPSGTPNAPDLIMPIIDKAKNQGIKHIVFIASHPPVMEAIKKSGIDYTFIQANFFMQNFEMYQTEDIRDRGQIFLPCGEGKAAFIHSHDIGEVGAALLTQHEDYKGKTLSITGPRAVDMFEAASVFTDVLGKSIAYKKPGDDEYRSEMEKRGASESYIKAMIGVFGMIKKGDAAQTSHTVKEILDREPLPLKTYVQQNKSLFIQG